MSASAPTCSRRAGGHARGRAPRAGRASRGSRRPSSRRRARPSRRPDRSGRSGGPSGTAASPLQQRHRWFDGVEAEVDDDPLPILEAQVIGHQGCAARDREAGGQLDAFRPRHGRQLEERELVGRTSGHGARRRHRPTSTSAGRHAGPGTHRAVQPGADAPLRDEERVPERLGLVEAVAGGVHGVVVRTELVGAGPRLRRLFH